MKLFGASLAATLISGMAFGAAGQSQSQGQGLQGSTTLDDLKAKCIELSANQQIKPFNIQITCSEVSTVWKEAAPTQMQLPNSREVGASLRMKNFEVPYVGQAVATDQSAANCAVLEKVRLTVPAVDVEVSCEELNQIANLTEFCTPHIDARVQQDPGLVIQERTNEFFNTCSGAGVKFDEKPAQSEKPTQGEAPTQGEEPTQGEAPSQDVPSQGEQPLK